LNQPLPSFRNIPHPLSPRCDFDKNKISLKIKKRNYRIDWTQKNPFASTPLSSDNFRLCEGREAKKSNTSIHELKRPPPP